MAKKDVKYIPDGRVLTRFFLDRNPVAIIQGPVGSGTSTACCHRIWHQANQQEPNAAGIRRSRWYIIRNTFNELKQTTLKTWKDWFEIEAGGALGEVKMTNPPEHFIKFPLPDGTVVDLEVIFLALDNEDDVKKLLSAEMTGVWFNEVQFSEKEIFDAAHSRAMQGRYPPLRDGGPTWKGVIADLNAPPEGHWIPYMRGDVPMPDDWTDEDRMGYEKPDDWSFYIQPAGLIEIIKDRRLVGYVENNLENRKEMKLRDPLAVAENTKWVPETYENLIKGKNKRWIDTFVMNRVGIYQAGEPVYQGYQDDIHVAKEPLRYNPHLPLVVGIDFARNPAMAAMQLLRSQLIVLGEYGVQNEAATTYAPLFKEWLMKKFPEAFKKGGPGIQFYGDPSGDSAGQGTDDTPYQIFRKHGMNVVPAPGDNNISLRVNTVQNQLNKMVDGAPGILLDPSCIQLKNGFNGGYHFARIKGTSAHHDHPNKRVRAADFHDGLQYGALGCGLGMEVLVGGSAPKPVKARRTKRYSLRGRSAR